MSVLPFCYDIRFSKILEYILEQMEVLFYLLMDSAF